ncbi:MAG: alanine racemase [Oscillospiraceae bacterium]|jgi:alanine racemase|nr:alanine racemase [Oscillospiraceae bacterium]
MLSETKRTWAEVSINALQYNINNLRAALPEGCLLCAAVKANAYGHGAVPVSKLLLSFGCDALAVATLDEAEELRSAGITAPMLILGYTPPEYTDRLIMANCDQTVGTLETARAYAQALAGTGQRLKIHIKLETGMGRTGFDVKRGDLTQILELLAMDCFDFVGVFSHFPVPEVPAQQDFTLRQLELFNSVVAELEAASGVKIPYKHCANSGAIIRYPQSHLDMVRAGITLYGLHPGAECTQLDLIPAMTLKSRIVQLFDLHPGDTVSYGRTFTAQRDMKIAVLGIGYADGLHRALSGKIDVLIGGVRCPQIGKICMDMCMVDVSALDEAEAKLQIGDVAVIFGRDKTGSIPLGELAEKAETISYELLCSITARVPRVYVN